MQATETATQGTVTLSLNKVPLVSSVLSVDMRLAELAELLDVPAYGKRPCGQCGGDGSVLVDPNDRRKGETTCDNCGGDGEL